MADLKDKRIAELEAMILEHQGAPYIVLKHDGKYYKCYEIKQIEGVKYE